MKRIVDKSQELLSRNLRQLRKEKNLTQAQLAKKAQISRSTYQDIEAGRTANPSLEVLKKVAYALDSPLSSLFNEVYEVGNQTKMLVLALIKANVHQGMYEPVIDAHTRLLAGLEAPEAPSNVESLDIADHAVVRWLERMEGINIEDIKAKMQGENLVARVKRLGDGAYPVEDGMVVVRHGKIITSYQNNGRDWRTVH